MTTLPALITPDDLSNWLGAPFSDQEEGRAELVVRAASVLVRKYARHSWVDQSNQLEAIPEEVFTVTLQVAERLWRARPAGVIQEQTGPFGLAFSVDYRALALTPEEKALLDGATGASPLPHVWTWATTRGEFPETAMVTYVDVEGSNEPVPWISEWPW